MPDYATDHGRSREDRGDVMVTSTEDDRATEAAGSSLSRTDPATAAKKTDIEPTAEAMGGQMRDEMTKVNTQHGYRVAYADSYYNWCQSIDPTKWKEAYRSGYADSTYWERTSFMQWRLQPGKSAAKAIHAWLEGPPIEPGFTIAECLSTLYAIETKTVLAAIGDEAFDKAFGKEGDAGSSKLELGVSHSSV